MLKCNTKIYILWFYVKKYSIKTQYKKPSPLPIPDVSEDKGLGYVEALFEAYSQTAGKKISHIDDLGIYKNHFKSLKFLKN